MLAPAILCHKEPARRIQSPLRRGYFACSSLDLYGKGIVGPIIGGSILDMEVTTLPDRDGRADVLTAGHQQTDQAPALAEPGVPGPGVVPGSQQGHQALVSHRAAVGDI